MKKLFATLLACAMTFTCAVPAFAAGGQVEMLSTPGQRGMIAEPLDIAWISPFGSQLSLGTIEGVHVIEKDSKIVITNTLDSAPGVENEFFSVFLRVYEPKKSGTTAIQYDPDTDMETVVDISDYMRSVGAYDLSNIKEDTNFSEEDMPYDNTKYWYCNVDVGNSPDIYNLAPGKSIEIELPDLGDGYAYAVGLYHSYFHEEDGYGDEGYCIFVTEDEKIGTFIKDKETETTVNNDKTEKDNKTETATANNNKAEATAKPSNFKDVADNAYYADAVKWAVENGITSGTSETTFSPNNTCTRAQILTFLWKANGALTVFGENPFTDVKESDYFYNAAKWAYYVGIIEDTTFAGNTPCTRSSTVGMMYQCHQLTHQ